MLVELMMITEFTFLAGKCSSVTSSAVLYYAYLIENFAMSEPVTVQKNSSEPRSKETILGRMFHPKQLTLSYLWAELIDPSITCFYVEN